MERLWKSDLEDGTFKNPIIFADYSDPDVIRVGDTFYMTASSFNYIPGLPILISKDLVNWKLVNYALDRIDYDNWILYDDKNKEITINNNSQKSHNINTYKYNL